MVRDKLEINAQRRTWYKAHCTERLNYQKEYRQKNKERCNEWSRRYYYSHLEKESCRKRKQRETMKTIDLNKLRERSRLDSMKYREKHPIEFRLRCRLAEAFKKYSVNGKLYHSKKYGIDFGAICRYIGSKPNNRENWHIDHIIPLSKFNFDDPQQVKQAFAPENHQWMIARENQEKSDKIIM